MNNFSSDSVSGNIQSKGYLEQPFTMIPRHFLRFQMQDLTHTELRVMLYIFDHTLGYAAEHGQRKIADAISRSQFLHGIKKADGTVIDRGAGVSERSLDRALDGLVRKNLIIRHHRIAQDGQWLVTVYALGDGGQGVRTGVREQGANNKQFPSVDDSSVLPNPQPLAPIPPQTAGTVPALLPQTPSRILPDTIENYQYKHIQDTHTQCSAPSPKILANTCVCAVSDNNLVEDKLAIKANQPLMAKPVVKQEFKKPAPPPPMPASPELEQLTEELLHARISKEQARNLAATALNNGHRPGYVRKALDYIACQQQIKNREGFLTYLVKTNWQPVDQPTQGDLSPKVATIPGLVLPTSVNPAHLPRLIEIETRNLAEARSDHERQVAQARLERLRQLEALQKSESTAKGVTQYASTQC